MVQSLSYEAVLTVIVYVQPVIVGLALFLVYRKRLASRSLFSQQRGVRRRLKSIRFFECASFSRLIGQLHYDLPILALSILFLLYDIDLVFFFAEAANWSNWGYWQIYWVGLCALLFVGGLWYDQKRFSFLWSW